MMRFLRQLLLISGELFLSLQFSSKDNESHGLSISRSVKWTHKPHSHCQHFGHGMAKILTRVLLFLGTFSQCRLLKICYLCLKIYPCRAPLRLQVLERLISCVVTEICRTTGLQLLLQSLFLNSLSSYAFKQYVSLNVTVFKR